MNSEKIEETYYDLLGLHPSASPMEIRRAYRELSKKYHPDTTTLPTTVATVKRRAANATGAPSRRGTHDTIEEQ